MTTHFRSWADRRTGLVEVTGPLDDHSIPNLRGAIADAVMCAGAPRVLIVEDGVTNVSDKAALVLISECATLRAKGGTLGLVSTDGNITLDGRPSARTLFMPIYNSLELGLAKLDGREFL